MLFDSIELNDGFLGKDRLFQLDPLNLELSHYHWYFIGRHLAQLHCSGSLMRDVSRENVMFRLSDGYPVLIDNPIPNSWGDRPEIYVSDLFVPAMNLTQPEFESFCCGYVECLQRLYQGPHGHLVDDILARTGGDFVGVPSVGASPGILKALKAVLRGDDFEVTSAEGDLLWLAIVLRFHEIRSPSLDALLVQLESSHERNVWPREAALLDRLIALELIDNAFDEGRLSFTSNRGLRAFVETAADGPDHDWATEFALFWIRVLSAMSEHLEANDPIASIQAAQTAHVVLQYSGFGAEPMYRALHNIRCIVSHREWYWLAAPEAGELDIHQFAFRNSECLSIAKLIDALNIGGSEAAMPLHLIFDLIELNRNLIGNLLLKALADDDPEVIRSFGSKIVPALLFRMHKTALLMIDYFSQHQNYCYHFGWRFRDLAALQPRDQETSVDDGREAEDRQMPAGMHDLMWATAALATALDGEAFDIVKFAEAYADIGKLWGGSWHTPFDRLGTNGFRAVVAKSGEDDSVGKVLRAGCGMVVFEQGLMPDDGPRYQILERLWPIPGHRRDNYFGADANP